MGIVKGPYDAAEWLTMKMLKFDSIPHLVRKNAEHKGKYEYNVKLDTDILKNYYQKEAA